MDNDNSKKYWKSLEEVEPLSPPESASNRSGPSFSRRGFLKAAGFTFGLTAIHSSGWAMKKAVPYLTQPEDVIQGSPYYYASTCGACTAGCGILVKNRDGRPIKLEGNPDHVISNGGLCPIGQASVLELYDRYRISDPIMSGKSTSWEAIDREIANSLEGIRKNQGAVRFLTNTVASPTTQNAINNFLNGFSNSRHVVYDTLSCSAILDAYEKTHGIRILPHYRLDRAEVIVSFDADFLGTWISPVEFTFAYASHRSPDSLNSRFSLHVQLESLLSLTGSRADKRVQVSPKDLGNIMCHLAARLAKKAGVELKALTLLSALPCPQALLDDLETRLWEAKGHSLVLCGVNDVKLQKLSAFMNHILENEGATVDIQIPSNQRQGSDSKLQALLEEIERGEVAALFISGVNPAYDLPNGGSLSKAISKIPLSISFSGLQDETSEAIKFLCPDHNFLESWSDIEAINGTLSIYQPAIQPIVNSRSMLESLAVWQGNPKSCLEILREYWETQIFPRATLVSSFQSFWDKTLNDGIVQVEPNAVSPKSFDFEALEAIDQSNSKESESHTLVLYNKTTMLDGSHAHNPWLQELPDPISKISWDNYFCLSPATAQSLRLKNGDRIEILSVDLPVLIQPGQNDSVIGVALGYGRKSSARFSQIGPKWLFSKPNQNELGLIGKNLSPLLRFKDGYLQYFQEEVQVKVVGGNYFLACTQTHHSLDVPPNLAFPGLERRPMIQETTLKEHFASVKKKVHSGEEMKEDLWPPDHQYPGHHWGMVIDLSKCTGCSACVVACQAENNIPVVGKDEVRRQREMHWIRIDRYYSGSGKDVDVAFQPMLCHHCNNAPCEVVCPVLATAHTDEGLNQQVYNRCVGTRYCANNCPYKVRRFNWFEYSHENKRENLVLNPDITVRSRGVMEKCTFCVHRIQEAKTQAKIQGRKLLDGEVQPACQQTCPARAIYFGDLNDPKSKVSKFIEDPRRYQVLAELNVRPAISYLGFIRNRS